MEEERTSMLSESSTLIDTQDDGLTTFAANRFAESTSERYKKHAIGLLLLILTVVNDIAQSEYAQWKFGDTDFSSYFFLTYFTNAWVIISFPIYIAVDYFHASMNTRCYGHTKNRILYDTGNSTVFQQIITIQSPSSWQHYKEYVKGKITEHYRFAHAIWKPYLLIALFVGSLNYFSSYTWYMSLDKIPVSINSALYQSEIVFVVILSILILKESISLVEGICLGVLVAGLALTGAGNIMYGGDSFSQNSQIFGYILVVIGAFLWACYEVALKRIMGEANSYMIMFLQSAIGVVILVLFWIPIPFLFYFHGEPTVDLTDSETLSFLFVNVAFAVTYYGLYAMAISLTDPIYVSVTSLLSIPVSAVADWVFHGDKYSPMTIVGMILVAAGIVGTNLRVFGFIRK